MRSALLLVLCALVAVCTADIWSSCGQKDDPILINNVVITPSTPVKGQPLTVSANITLTEDVTNGSISFDVKYSIIPIFKKVEPLCALVQPFDPCPIKAGTIVKSITETIPSQAPHGKYSGHVVLTDQNNKELACINVAFSL